MPGFLSTDGPLPQGSMISVIGGDSSQLVPADEMDRVIAGRTKLKLSEVKPDKFNFWQNTNGPMPKYLIRVDIGPQSRPHADLTVICSFWQFPKMPNLDFIEQIYVCEAEGCDGVMDKDQRARMASGPAVWVCPKCFAVFQEGDEDEELSPGVKVSLLEGARGFLGSGMFAFARPVPGIAEVIARYWERFGGLCEIMLMRRRLSVQKMVNRYLSGEYGRDADIAYTKSAGSDAKTGVVGCYYTLAGLMKDTAAGSTLRTRLGVFLAGG